MKLSSPFKESMYEAQTLPITKKIGSNYSSMRPTNDAGNISDHRYVITVDNDTAIIARR